VRVIYYEDTGLFDSGSLLSLKRIARPRRC
jgi:hypothetical protein